jgi:mRNA interferase RelE/StbE
MRYTVRFKPAAAKEFAKLPRDVQRRLTPRIDALAANPRPPGREKLSGMEAWRIRVGDYRIVYT